MNTNINMNITLEQVLLIYNLYNGLLKPVDKLINKKELYEILDNYTFNNTVYSLPYLFFIDKSLDNNIKTITCFYNNIEVSIIEVEDIFEIDLNAVVYKIFNTNDISHPGVTSLLTNHNKNCLSGFIKTFDYDIHIPFSQIKQIKGTVFQSRNPPHKAHEFIIDKFSPNLIYTTPYSTSKKTDYSFEIKIECYKKIKELYNIEILVTTLPRLFAGPREALQNCILFQNLGADKFIMGRGKNCVGNFYGEDESYLFCKQYYEAELLKIEPFWIETMHDNDIEIKASYIKTHFIDKNIIPPDTLMSDYISEILL
jgi:sulfate adenylyltransferase